MMAHLLLMQGSIIMLSVILSAMVFFPLGTITSNIGGQCLLFSRIYLSVRNFSLITPAKLDLTRTEFGSVDECDYTTFLSVTVTVTGLIFLWFLLHFGRLSEFDKPESGFLVSVLLFYLVLFICVIISSIKISSGFSYWCDNINVCVDGGATSACKKLACDMFSSLTLEDTYEDTSKFYTYFELAEISSWLLTLTLLFECVVTSQRIYQNFKASFTEEEQAMKKFEESSNPSKLGIINIGSDEYIEDATGGELLASPNLVNRTVAEVTVHKDNMALESVDSMEMSAVPDISEVQISVETELKPSREKQSELLTQSNETDSIKPRSRRRKAET